MKVITPVNIIPNMITTSVAEPRTAADYNSGTNYNSDDLVKDPVSHIVYKSLLPNNSNNIPGGSASDVWWLPIGYNEIVWSGVTTYAAGDVAYYNHRVYLSLQAANTNQNPATMDAWWQDVGPTNAWGMFDTLRNTASVDSGPITIVITPATRIGAFALLGIIADSATINMTVNGVNVYSRTVNFISRTGVINGYTYFFNAFTQTDSFAFFDLPPYSNGVLTIVFNKASGKASVGAVVVGQYTDIGAVQYDNMVDSALNFSTIDRDAYGNSELIRRRSVPKTDQTLWAPKASVPGIRTLRDSLNAVPAVWCGLDDATDAYFPSLLILGIYKQFDIGIPYTDTVVITLELEEV